MLSQTRRALEDFDNQHDFERMAADILNALGYSHVEPMAPAGGSDVGRDIAFREGETPGIALVTLDKKIRDKFKGDLAKQGNAEGVIALFCNVDVSPAMKLAFARDAISKGYRIEVFDLERLRSLLDSSVKDVRRRYLKIDDEIAAQLRSEVRKLLRFPDAVQDVSIPASILEGMLTNKLPRRLFDLILNYEEEMVREVPALGEALHNHLTAYYRFRQDALRIEDDLITKIGLLVSVRFRQAWIIYLKYAFMRFFGLSKETIMAGHNFLNFDITWDESERVFVQLSNETQISSSVSGLSERYGRLSEHVAALIQAMN